MTVYGTRIMAATATPVPADVLRAGMLLHQASRLTEGRGREIHDFCALQVKHSDVAAHLGAGALTGLDG